MKYWERYSEIIYKTAARKPLGIFEKYSIDKVLSLSLQTLNEESKGEIRSFIKDQQTTTGGFKDKGGKADLYYTLFGHFITEALGMADATILTRNFVASEMNSKELSGVHMHCAAILASKLHINAQGNYLNRQVRKSIRETLHKQPAYNAFMNLLTCYYISDFTGLYMVGRQLERNNKESALPCPVYAALLVLRHSFGQNINGTVNALWSFYDGKGGFRAVKSAPMSDLLSTAVALYALKFAGVDLRKIRPQCLDYVDGLYNNGGFSANIIDSDTDIEYTFYGLLALGALY